MFLMASSKMASTLSASLSSFLSFPDSFVGVLTLPVRVDWGRDRLRTSGGRVTWFGSWHSAILSRMRPIIAACSTCKPTECKSPTWADLGGGGRGARPPLFSCIFEKFLTLSLTFGHKCSQNDVKQHHQFLLPPLSGFSGSAPDQNY